MEDDVPDLGRMLAEDRIPEFLIHLEASAKKAAEVESRRPTWDELSHELLTLQGLFDSTVLDGEGHPLSPLRLRPATGSSQLQAEALRLQHSHLNESHALVLQLLESYAVATSDHLRGLATLMLVDPPVRPALALGRVLLDAAVHVIYLLEQEIPASERGVRAANIRLDGLGAELNDLHRGIDDEHVLRIESEMQDLYAKGLADGIRRQTDKHGRVQRFLLPPLVKTEKMTSFVLGSEGRRVWRTLSSVVHAQDRSIISFMSGRGFVGQKVQGRRYGALQLFPCIFAAVEAIRRLASATGNDHLSLHMQTNNTLHIWSIAAGLVEMPS